MHKVADDVLYAVIRGLNQRIDDMDETGLILFSRSFREVVPLRDAEGKITTLVVPLDGLDREACRNLLPSLEPVDEVTYQHIYGLSRGHPLVLNLIDRGSIGTTFYETLEMYVEKEIFSKLSGAEKFYEMTLSLPLFYGMKNQDVKRIVSALSKVLSIND